MPAPESSEAAPRRPTDVDLLERVVDRDEAALGELYDRFAGILLAVIQRIVGAGGEAEEVLQETFLQVWKQASRYDDGRSSVSNWLSLIARSRAIDRLRSRRVKERTALAAEAEKAETDVAPEGVGNVLLKERRRRLRASLAKLPEEQRDVIEHAFFRGLTQREIAEETGIPLGTVKTRTLLAMKKLRQDLRGEVGELI
ncbi:MAG: sigma-70 family RNA polymerase sigma factor [Thermoanaerobaculia bacterium]|nr:sigma-70 family RNA polymerase sigma factor [Thermoanaerobaculia bacterium]